MLPLGTMGTLRKSISRASLRFEKVAKGAQPDNLLRALWMPFSRVSDPNLIGSDFNTQILDSDPSHDRKLSKKKENMLKEHKK